MRVEAHGKLISALRNAHAWLDELLADPGASTAASPLAKAGRTLGSDDAIARLCRSGVIALALDRRLPRGFGMSRLTDLPSDWRDQRQVSG